MAKIVNKYSLLLTLTVGVAILAYYQSDTTVEDMGEQIALKLMEMLPRKHRGNSDLPPVAPSAARRSETTPRSNNESTTTEESEDEPEEAPSKASEYDPVGHYNAKDAMQNRYEALRETCKKYSDFMRPERMLMYVTPELSDYVFNPASELMFCPIHKVGKKNFSVLFDRLKEAKCDCESKVKALKNGFPNAARDWKKALMVRHPLERLVSAYRYTYEKRLNAATNEEEGGEISFPDFVQLLIHGASEFADFMEENQVQGESAAIDTGMIDGEGVSNAWNPYWRQCGVCSPSLQPHFILHMDHYKEDVKVLLEMMGNPPNGEIFLELEHEVKSGLREVEEHYFSQVTKAEVRELYEKYKVDHELFGFSPDYYIALAKDN